MQGRRGIFFQCLLLLWKVPTSVKKIDNNRFQPHYFLQM